MKYLKKFNEGLDDDGFEKLKDFCDNCLAYLIDDGFINSYSKIYKDGFDTENDNPDWLISIRKPIKPFYETFKWIDVKDHIIRFVYLITIKF